MSRRVVIVGGGATGVAAFIALVRHRAAERIDIVDPTPAGLGRAFSATHPALLCNTSVGIMSLLHHAPDDFLDHLRTQDVDADRDSFVPRAHFSHYARDRYRRYVHLHRRQGGSSGQTHRRATAIHRGHDGRYAVVCDDGTRLDATDVLLCQGYGDPVVPQPLRKHLGTPGLFITPYPENTLLAAVPPGSRVLVLGTRLSAIDAALLLCGAGHRVVMASPSGELPAVRTRTAHRPGLIDPSALAALDFTGPLLDHRVLALVAKATATYGPYRLRDQVHVTASGDVDDAAERLRAETRLAENGTTAWQDILCAIVDAANAALPSLDTTVRNTALHKCAHLLRYLGAIPLATAHRLGHHVDTGLLSIRRGVPRRYDHDGRWRAIWPDGEHDAYDAVVTATGYGAPQLAADGTRVLLTRDHLAGPLAHAAPDIGEDLRLTLPGRDAPEGIWTVGVTSATRVPSVNAVYPAVQQADAVARAVTSETGWGNCCLPCTGAGVMQG